MKECVFPFSMSEMQTWKREELSNLDHSVEVTGWGVWNKQIEDSWVPDTKELP